MRITNTTINKYIDPMVDFAFKKIFRDSGKKHLIIRPLNAVFGLDIVDVDIRDAEQLGATKEERRAYFDLFCTTLDGNSFIIEVQLANQPFFMERAIYYSSFLVSKQAERGQWNYELDPVFFLGLLNFDIRHLEQEKADPARFIHRFSLREDETHEPMSRTLRFAFLEVARFDKPKEECLSFEDRFLYIMKNLPNFVEEPQLWDDDYFDDLMEEAEFANMTLEQRWEYFQAMKNKWDYQNTIDFARKEGREEGREEGAAMQAEETARRMLADNVPFEVIAKYSGLTEEQVRAL